VPFLVIVALLATAVGLTLGYDPPQVGTGNVSTPAHGQTLVSVQGFHFQGYGNKKKPAHLLGVGPRGTVQWRHGGPSSDTNWFYDVDPLPEGTVLVTATVPGDTIVYEYDPETRDVLWRQRFDAKDTHDVDLINGDELLVANMRNYNASSDAVSNDRVFVYDLSRDEVVWSWFFKNHYDAEASGDWTHVNDVDKVGISTR
jgi:hypothetical protein